MFTPSWFEKFGKDKRLVQDFDDKWGIKEGVDFLFLLIGNLQLRQLVTLKVVLRLELIQDQVARSFIVGLPPT